RLCLVTSGLLFFESTGITDGPTRSAATTVNESAVQSKSLRFNGSLLEKVGSSGCTLLTQPDTRRQHFQAAASIGSAAEAQKFTIGRATPAHSPVAQYCSRQ